MLLGGKNEGIKRDFDNESKNIYDAFITGQTAFPECYQEHTWAQDSVFALESLRLHDAMRGTKYSGAYQRWLAELKEHIDPQTRLMVAQIDPSTNKSIEGSMQIVVFMAIDDLLEEMTIRPAIVGKLYNDS